MKTYYLIILGEFSNCHYNNMIDRIEQLGNTRRLLDNIYVYESKPGDTVESVRTTLSGNDIAYCMVMEIPEGFNCAWSMTRESSSYFKQLTEDIG